MAASAVSCALELLDRPILAGAMQDQQLPPDTLTLLKIAAGDKDVIKSAALATSRSPQRIQQASILYIQRILFAPGATCYRMLGAEPNATQPELRQRLALLMRWLHPDHTKSQWDSAFAGRVLTAWEQLKTPERRRHYDAILAAEVIAQRQPRPRRPTQRVPWISNRPQAGGVQRGPRIGQLALAAIVVITTLCAPNWPMAPRRSVWVAASTSAAPFVGKRRPVGRRHIQWTVDHPRVAQHAPVPRA